MTRSEILKRLKASEAELRCMGVGKLYLFGSAARGEPQPNDIDLLYEIGDAPRFSYLDQAGAEIALEKILGKPVDLVLRRALHERMRPAIEAEMVEVF